MSADAQPNSKQRATDEDTKPPSQARTLIGTLCVVCGDRACSHLYYGVAACHGCKCFFWRTVKSRLTYTCRYDGKCSMSTAGRNACRYCRFMRCIDSGMKLDAVRMDKKPEKAAKRKKAEPESDEYDEEPTFTPEAKRQRMDNRLLASSLLLIDRTATDGNGRNGFYESTRSLIEAISRPDVLDGYRTEMIFSAKVAADSVACEYGERRLFVWALDWTHQAADIEETLSFDDKIALLRACYAPLSLLQLSWHCSMGSDVILPLPNGSFLARDAPLPDGCFLNNKLRQDHPRLDIIRSGASLTVSSPSMLLRNNTPTHAALNRQTFPSTRSGESKGFAATLLDRLLSLGNSPRHSAPIVNGIAAPRRNYDSYDVTFDHGPVGLDLETDWYGRQAVVKGFRAVNSAGDEGPAKRCGMIRVGDVLTAINGDSCLEMNFQETLEALRMAGKSRHTLHFKSLEAAGDLSIYASDKDLVQARAFIHQHKQRFYRAPRAVEGTNPHELVLGCIERLRGEFVTALNFHREETGEFLLAASCASDGSGPFIFHTLRDSHLRTMRELPQSEDSAVYLGRLEPSFLGTEFTLFDHHTDSSQQHDNELAFLVYSANVLGRVPNSLKCVVSKPVEDADEDNLEILENPSALGQKRSGMGSDGAVFNTHRARSGRNTSLSDRFSRQQQSRSMSITERLKSFTLDDLDLRLEMATDGALGWLDDDDVDGHARSMRVKQARLRGERTASMGEVPYGAVEQEEFEKDLLVFETKQPSWNEQLGAWTLNFQGRVKVASKKNFLLVGNDTNEHGDEVEITALRFGKVSKTRFTLDYAAPLAPIQALSVACSAFANKRAVT